MPEVTVTADATIDITRESCPMTYVRTKLKLETLGEGQVLEVLLKGDEPLKNVPRNLKDDGHHVLSLEQAASGVWRLLVRKQEAR